MPTSSSFFGQNQSVAGIGILGTFSRPGIGAYLSTWIPELSKTNCSYKAMNVCHPFVWGSCVQNDVRVNSHPCCMDGYEWRCCTKASRTNKIMCKHKLHWDESGQNPKFQFR
ncbi:hypothetical protein niasHS_012487 [Heterodera schachtii]|uniref:Uncharacterized protein n=1 Tax=Heterodera schachtii TaxID=97005 RepID=A0ABD2I988_HETSC